jgi:hypothetical protein
MKIFDPHIHMFSRTTDDYEMMALCGIRAVMEPSFWLGQPRTRVGSFEDYWSAITEFEPGRAAQFGIRHFCSISLNPKEANDTALAAEVLAAMESRLAHPRVVAVGEIGFDRLTAAEEKALRHQLELARRHGLPVVFHLPHADKLRGAERAIAILKEMDYPEEMVDLDHNTEETIPLVKEKTACWAGHTVYTRTKLTPARAANILEEFGTERMLINSSADWGVSDPLNVPRTVLELRRRGVAEETIEQVVWHNPAAFYRQSGKLDI